MIYAALACIHTNICYFCNQKLLHDILFKFRLILSNCAFVYLVMEIVTYCMILTRTFFSKSKPQNKVDPYEI